MTNIELQAFRRFFMLKISEASEFIGNVDRETWIDWELGNQPIPDAVVEKMCALKKARQDKVDKIIQDINNRIGSNNIRYFMRFDDFKEINPDLNVIDWRLHQSISTELYLRGLEKLC